MLNFFKPARPAKIIPSHAVARAKFRALPTSFHSHVAAAFEAGMDECDGAIEHNRPICMREWVKYYPAESIRDAFFAGIEYRAKTRGADAH
ncbi:uncharacterized protein E1O_06920 [Burkholderiales bacterium GJ-E10]|nr:uncharacterized protein E1O_06920 [Burkholderiales bacterium GJ-E10]